MYIFHDGKGIKLTDIPEFCTSTLDDDETCVTSFIDSSMSCVRKSSIKSNDLFSSNPYKVLNKLLPTCKLLVLDSNLC